MTAIILDTETTDVAEGMEVMEVMELAYINYLEPHHPFLKRYKPDKPPKFGACAVHHILPSDVEACDPSANARHDVVPATYWIGHNIDFDWRALGSPSHIKRIDTLAFSRSLWPECDGHTLSAMMYFTHGMNEATRGRVRQAHSALDDVLMCQDLLKVILKVTHITDLETLWEESEEARIPRLWTFGKFKGQRIEDADRGYANWCRKQPDFDPYVLKALKRAGL
jgi:exodeoxyribonuclease X